MNGEPVGHQSFSLFENILSWTPWDFVDTVGEQVKLQLYLYQTRKQGEVNQGALMNSSRADLSHVLGGASRCCLKKPIIRVR